MKYYDAIALGGGLNTLVTAALLAQRSWRILVIGQGFKENIYRYESLPLARRLDPPPLPSVPIGAKIFGSWNPPSSRKLSAPRSPVFQLLGPKYRFDWLADPERQTDEIKREFPDIFSDFQACVEELARCSAAMDQLTIGDVPLLPHGFWERRRCRQACAPLASWTDAKWRPLARLAEGHPLRRALEVIPLFASSLAPPIPPLSMARLVSLALKSDPLSATSEVDLIQSLSQKIRSAGGDLLLHDRAVRIYLRRNAVQGVLLHSNESRVGTELLFSDRSIQELSPLFEPHVEWPERLAVGGKSRCTVSVLVRSEGLPQPLGTHAYLFGAQGEEPIHLQRVPDVEPGIDRLMLERLLPEKEGVATAREVVLSRLQDLFPFVERHLMLVDCTQDGRELWDYRSGGRVDVPRGQLREAKADSCDEMPLQWNAQSDHLFGLGSAVSDSRVRGLSWVGRELLPGLGYEGGLLTAWLTAERMAKSLPLKEQMHREMRMR